MFYFSCSDHVCMRFLEKGYDFYALDLRKCGRSIISPEHDQYKHYCNDLRDYDEEITLTIEHITKEANTQNRKILLFGHSTGKKLLKSYRKYSRFRALPYILYSNEIRMPSILFNTLCRRSYCYSLRKFWFKKC